MKNLLCISRTSLMTLVFLILSACSPDSNDKFFDYSRVAAEQYPEKYTNAIRRAKDYLSREDYASALRELVAASKEDLFEWPNYELWDDIASASCLAGKYNQCRQYIDYYETALNITDGIVLCYLTEKDENTGRVNPEILPYVAEVMCHPALTYGFGSNASSNIQQEAQRERAQLLELKKLLHQ